MRGHALELATVAKELGVRPSSLLGIEDAYTAWCLDEAMVQFRLLLAKKKKLKPKDTADNTELLREMGVL